MRKGRASLSASVALAAILAVALAACAGVRPAASVAPPTTTPSLTAPAGNAGAAPLVVDTSLLAILPTSVAGVALLPAPVTAAGMIADPMLQTTTAAVAVGSVVAPGDSRGDDLAIATVIRLRPGVYSDAFYTRWRADYDAAACEPAGGISSHVQQRIGQHPVEETVCVQGARTYHTYLGGDLLISITGVGDRKFGDLVMAGLRQ